MEQKSNINHHKPSGAANLRRKAGSYGDLSGYDIAGFTYSNNHWFGNEQTGETYETFF